MKIRKFLTVKNIAITVLVITYVFLFFVSFVGILGKENPQTITKTVKVEVPADCECPDPAAACVKLLNDAETIRGII